MWGKLNHCRALLTASCTKPIELQQQQHRFKPSCRLPGCPARCGPSRRGKQIECCLCLWRRWSGSRWFFSRSDWGWQTCLGWTLFLLPRLAGDLAERDERAKAAHESHCGVFSWYIKAQEKEQANTVIRNDCRTFEWDCETFQGGNKSNFLFQMKGEFTSNKTHPRSSQCMPLQQYLLCYDC